MARVKAVGPRVSYADLERMPDDGRRYELYDGEMVVVPAPLPIHQIVALNIADLLRSHGRTSAGFTLVSPIDILFTEHDVLQPDVVYFEPARRRLIDFYSVIRVPPDLAVEVISPSTESRDRGRKLRMFERFGVREYWIVEPLQRTVEIRALTPAGYLLAQPPSSDGQLWSRLLPEIDLPVAEIFRLPQ